MTNKGLPPTDRGRGMTHDGVNPKIRTERPPPPKPQGVPPKPAEEKAKK